MDRRTLIKSAAVLAAPAIAPKRFIGLFEGSSRKKAGVLALPARSEALPSTQVSLKAIPRLEEVVVAEIETKALRLPTLLPKEDNNDGKQTHKPAA